MNFKLLLIFALVALVVAVSAQQGGKGGKRPKGGKGGKGPKDSGEEGGNTGKGGKGGPKNPKGPKGPKDSGEDSGETSGENSGEVTTTLAPGPDTGIEVCTETSGCECGDSSKGFQTYTFVQNGVTRCFTVFHPISRAGESLPVVISSQCYGKDKLMSISMKNDKAADNQAAARYGYARIGVSTPDGHWTFGNNGI